MITTTLYVKRGRRYIPWGNVQDWHDGDRMEAGTFRLTHCVGDGSTRYHHAVTPDTAAFLAAASIAQVAMEAAMRQAAIATPQQAAPYTPRQRQLIEQFRRDMTAAGALVPSIWQHASPAQIAAAGIEAVRNALAQPVPAAPTDEELFCLEDLRDAWNAQADPINSWDELGMDEIIWFAQQQALTRWGHPTPQPIPVSERLPEAGDCDAEGQIWAWYCDDPDVEYEGNFWTPLYLRLVTASHNVTHWLPATALPLPAGEVQP